MRMSTQFTVSVQTLLLIMVSGEGNKVTSGMISESTGCNPVMIRQLFGKLKDAGLLNISTGKGATTLAKKPAEISLWDVYMAVEGHNASELFKFHPKISEDCQVGKRFRSILGSHLDEAVRAMREKMSRVSLTQLIDEMRALSKKEEKTQESIFNPKLQAK